MDDDEMMEGFTLRSVRDMVQVRLNKVHGFPDTTSHFGGYDAEGTVDIWCDPYHVRAPFWFSTGRVWQFFQELQQAYTQLAGSARFHSTEDELDFTLTFPTAPLSARGFWVLEGAYRHDLRYRTQLLFEMSNDQSYLIDTLAQLSRFVARYGDNRGVHT